MRAIVLILVLTMIGACCSKHKPSNDDSFEKLPIIADEVEYIEVDMGRSYAEFLESTTKRDPIRFSIDEQKTFINQWNTSELNLFCKVRTEYAVNVQFKDGCNRKFIGWAYDLKEKDGPCWSISDTKFFSKFCGTN